MICQCPRTPEQRIIGAQASGKGATVAKQRIALVVNAAEQRQIEAVNAGDGGKIAAGRVPDIGLSPGQPTDIWRGGDWRSSASAMRVNWVRRTLFSL